MIISRMEISHNLTTNNLRRELAVYKTPQYLLLLLIADPVGHRVGREQVERLGLGDSEHEVGLGGVALHQVVGHVGDNSPIHVGTHRGRVGRGLDDDVKELSDVFASKAVGKVDVKRAACLGIFTNLMNR